MGITERDCGTEGRAGEDRNVDVVIGKADGTGEQKIVRRARRTMQKKGDALGEVSGCMEYEDMFDVPSGVSTAKHRRTCV